MSSWVRMTYCRSQTDIRCSLRYTTTTSTGTMRRSMPSDSPSRSPEPVLSLRPDTWQCAHRHSDAELGIMIALWMDREQIPRLLTTSCYPRQPCELHHQDSAQSQDQAWHRVWQTHIQRQVLRPNMPQFMHHKYMKRLRISTNSYVLSSDLTLDMDDPLRPEPRASWLRTRSLELPYTLGLNSAPGTSAWWRYTGPTRMTSILIPQRSMPWLYGKRTFESCKIWGPFWYTYALIPPGIYAEYHWLTKHQAMVLQLGHGYHTGATEPDLMSALFGTMDIRYMERTESLSIMATTSGLRHIQSGMIPRPLLWSTYSMGKPLGFPIWTGFGHHHRHYEQGP